MCIKRQGDLKWLYFH